MPVKNWHGGQLVVFSIACVLIGVGAWLWAMSVRCSPFSYCSDYSLPLKIVGCLVLAAPLIPAWRWFGARKQPPSADT